MSNHTWKHSPSWMDWLQDLRLYRLISRVIDSLLTVRKLGLLLLGLAIINGVTGYFIAHPGETFTFQKLTSDFYSNASTELISIAFTVLIIDWLNHRSLDKYQKRSLILQMGSPDNVLAVEAVRQLCQNGWLIDGSLRGVNLKEANLEGADLEGANLQGAILCRANLQGAKLSKANLRHADLYEANLRKAVLEEADLEGTRLEEADLSEADFRGADLENANLRVANLQNAILREADLHDADLYEANLEGSNLREADLHDADLYEANLQNANLRQANLHDADLYEANLEGTNLSETDLRGAILVNANLSGVLSSRITRFDANTILPDESRWSRQTDLGRFTNASRGDFWRSEDRHSPACEPEPTPTEATTTPLHVPPKPSDVTLDTLLNKLDALSLDMAAVKAAMDSTRTVK
jgi:uncharacterized protein YjbI with pentapeptide repeats